jgi:outer membrane protein with beta-barrel domain
MTRWIAVLILAIGIAGANRASAQETSPGPGTVAVTIIPGGATFFTESSHGKGPSFGNYGLGGAVEVNFNRWVGVEGEVAGSLGITQNLTQSGVTSNLKTPNLLNYSGNAVVHLANASSLTPYVTGGVGGLTVFDTATLGISKTDTFLTGNVGAGVKWFHSSGRWGVRGDYRFIAVRSKDDAPSFFGQDTRYGNRVYGGVVINAVR